MSTYYPRIAVFWNNLRSQNKRWDYTNISFHSSCNTKSLWQKSKWTAISCKIDTFARILCIFSLKFLTTAWQIAFPRAPWNKEKKFYCCTPIWFPSLLKSKRHILCTDILLSGISQLLLFSYITKMSHKCTESDRYCMSLKHLEKDTQG